MSSNRFVGALWLMVSLFGCEEGGGGDEGSAGQLGESCIGGSFCNEGLVCSAGVCMGGDDEVGEGDSSEGESSEGESGESDVPSDPADTSPPVFELYEGPCTSSDECTGDTWCANDEADRGARWTA